MLLKFTKMQGLKNDFMVVNGVTQKVFFSPDLIKKLADRHSGIGFDQLLLIEPPYDPNVDFHYRVFNPDGEEALQGINGASCFAKFVLEHRLISKKEISVSTASGLLSLKVAKDNSIIVNLAEPKVTAAADNLKTVELCGRTYITACNKEVPKDFFDMVIHSFTEKNKFKEKPEVVICRIINPHKLTFNLYDSNGGRLKAGIQAYCCAGAAGILQGGIQSPVAVENERDVLTIYWDGEASLVKFSEEVVRIFDGSVAI
ncbi:MAG TPA: diaminopimelate epimerase [Succinivibrionaceae bacterium]|nr:diaminopimelate epimerase [Succinivibrionaceae bacterium]